MKVYLFLVFSLLAISFPTLAADLDDFYTWTSKSLCKTGNHDCDTPSVRAYVQLLSGETGSYFQYVRTDQYENKTCNVKVINTKNESNNHWKGERAYIQCVFISGKGRYAEEFPYKVFPKWLIKNYDSELDDIYNQAIKKRDIKILNRLVSEFSHHKVSTLAKNSIMNLNSEEKQQRQKVINEYRNAKTIQQKAEVLAKTNNREKVSNGALKYSDVVDDNMASKFVSDIFKSVKKENNIAGYSWFIKNNPSSKQAKQALASMHKLAFELAEDIDTINAYNDFVIAYPTAKQVREANDKAYELEKSEYVGMLNYFSEEKDARRLLVQSKMLEQSAEDLSSDEKVGYMMVVNRMNDLLKQEFNSTDAALRHLESNEFKSFVKTFKRSMKDLKHQVSRIADNTADLSSIMKQQSSMMNNHFENAAQDREMASELTKQHRHWERFIGEVGL
tara:strand:- start:398 stop:1738 length:1341 start_codon:yes stop_codon:yes gene_type:complete